MRNEQINKIAKKHNLSVIEDSSQAHGAKHHNRYAGTMSDMDFSFTQVKIWEQLVKEAP